MIEPFGFELPCFVLFSWSVYPTPLARNLRANAAKVKVIYIKKGYEVENSKEQASIPKKDRNRK